MPKIPSLSELTNKVKSAVDTLMGPATSQVTQEAIAKESDPTKAKLLEIELLINQLHDVQLIQTKTINALKTKYGALQKVVHTVLTPENPQPTTETEHTEALSSKEKMKESADLTKPKTTTKPKKDDE